jgi:hypothetical protein
MTEEQLLNTPGLQAVAVETEVKELVATGERCVASWEDGGASSRRDIMLWTDPVALDIHDESAFEGSTTWVRVAN